MTRNRNPQPGRSIRRDLQDRNVRLIQLIQKVQVVMTEICTKYALPAEEVKAIFEKHGI